MGWSWTEVSGAESWVMPMICCQFVPDMT
ncbi:hypothetical protein HNQ08_002525 [Deinococcus humi]|uniref:Uncharacterized protein n=1 Tax=Deinococcus humi TaxID=662880 RepID=A0A7W8JUC7_9DEIO|nr:hypothetical protein [Deinococcus humi]